MKFYFPSRKRAVIAKDKIIKFVQFFLHPFIKYDEAVVDVKNMKIEWTLLK